MRISILNENVKEEEFELDDYLAQKDLATGLVSFTSKWETFMFTSDAAPMHVIEHDSILQTLDRESNGTYLGKEFFEPTVEEWDRVPLIFAQDHPDPRAYDADQEAELKRIKGRLVKGRASGTSIETTGHPRLMTKLILNDPEVEKGIAEGKISTSNGFLGKAEKGALAGTVRPHHILFFYEMPGGPTPGDRGVMILNQRKNPVTQYFMETAVEGPKDDSESISLSAEEVLEEFEKTRSRRQ